MSSFQVLVLAILGVGIAVVVWFLQALRVELVGTRAELVKLGKVRKLVGVLHADLAKSQFLETVPKILERAQQVSELTEKLVTDIANTAMGAVMSHDFIASQQDKIAALKAQNLEHQRILGIVPASGDDPKVTVADETPLKPPMPAAPQVKPSGGAARARGLTSDEGAAAVKAFAKSALNGALGDKNAARIEGGVSMGDDGGKPIPGFFPPAPLKGAPATETPREITLGAKSGRDGTE